MYLYLWSIWVNTCVCKIRYGTRFLFFSLFGIWLSSSSPYPFLKFLKIVLIAFVHFSKINCMVVFLYSVFCSIDLYIYSFSSIMLYWILQLPSNPWCVWDFFVFCLYNHVKNESGSWNYYILQVENVFYKFSLLDFDRMYMLENVFSDTVEENAVNLVEGDFEIIGLIRKSK